MRNGLAHQNILPINQDKAFVKVQITNKFYTQIDFDVTFTRAQLRDFALFIANTCGMGIDGALKAMHFIRAWGFHTVSELGLKWPHYKQSEKEIRKNEQLIEQAADKLYQHMSRDESEPQIEQIKQFYIMRAPWVLILSTAISPRI